MFGHFKTLPLIRAWRPITILAALGLSSALAGCADLRQATSLNPGGVDPSSPIAREAVAASRGRLRMPRFADIPKAPSDLRAPSAIKSDVGSMIGERRKLNSIVARFPPAQSDTDLFAEKTTAPLLARGLTPPPPDQADLTTDFAEVTRASVQPPADPGSPDPSSPPPQPDARPGRTPRP